MLKRLIHACYNTLLLYILILIHACYNTLLLYILIFDMSVA